MIALNADIQCENQKKDQLQEARDGQLKKLREIFQSDAEQLELVSYNAVNISHTTLSIHTVPIHITDTQERNLTYSNGLKRNMFCIFVISGLRSR